MFVFYFMFPFSFKFLQTSVITQELIKHKNKFNRKFFHALENSENRFSEFSYFMTGFLYHEHFSVVYTMKKTIVKFVFHEMF